MCQHARLEDDLKAFRPLLYFGHTQQEPRMSSARDRIKGSITALVTPMKGGKVDEAAFGKLVSWQIAEGSHGLVPCGTTGESPTLSHDEHVRVIELCVE